MTDRNQVSWGKSDEGFVESKCGTFSIEPQYWGSVAPRNYILKKNGVRVGGMFDTQRDAKLAAKSQ